jgi:hypothetical protein
MFDEEAECAARVEVADIERAAVALRDRIADATGTLFVTDEGAHWRFASPQLIELYNAFDAVSLACVVLKTGKLPKGATSDGTPVTGSPIVGTLKLAARSVDGILSALNRYLARQPAPRKVKAAA